MIRDETQGHLTHVREWAAAQEPSLLALLEEQLTYLGTYACHIEDAEGDGDPRKTICCLYPDFAPQSFEFRMYRALPADVTLDEGENDPRVRHGLIRCFDGRWYGFWFNGGLIFHDDRGFSGGAPTFSVSLNDGRGARWEVHT